MREPHPTPAREDRRSRVAHRGGSSWAAATASMRKHALENRGCGGAILVAILCCAIAAPPAFADSSPAPADAVAQLNQWRARVGVAPVAFDADNTEGCRLHSLYYAANGTLGHDEDSSRPGFTEPGAKAAASSALAYGSGPPGPYAWEWAVYHRIALLNPDLAASGYWSEHGISCALRSSPTGSPPRRSRSRTPARRARAISTAGSCCWRTYR